MNARAATPASLVLSAVVVLTAGCSGDGIREVSATTSSDAAEASFTVEEMGEFSDPWAMAFLPSGDLLVTERTGTLQMRDTDTGESVEVGGVPDVAVAGQGGLGDVALGPNFAEDQMVYLSWVEQGEGGSGAVVGRARLETGEAPTLEGLEIIWRQAPKVSGEGHFSHRLAFDPEGEHLFVSSGDRQKKTPAQDTSNTLGSIVRMGLDGSAPQIWSYGHRNPLGLEFAPDGNLWSSEMGPEGGDELNLIEQDGNYGWPEVSNGSDYGGGEIPDHSAGDGFVAPKTFWKPSISPGSLLIYSGDLFPEWEGDAFIGALSGEALVHVDIDGTSAGDTQTFEMGERIRAVEQGPDGAIWLLEDGGSGQLLRLTPAAS